MYGVGLELGRNYAFSVKKIVTLGVGFLLISLVAILVIRYGVINDNAPLLAPVKTRSFSKPFHDIKGFYYSKTIEGQRLFSIWADRFRVQKKKMGLIRFGLLKEIVVDNAAIDIYQSPQVPFSVEPLADPQTMQQFKGKSTADIVFKPVRIRIMSLDGKIISQILSKSAGLKVKQKQIFFEQGLVILSDNKILTTTNPARISKTGQVIIPQGAVLKTDEKIIQNCLLQTDIFLKNIQEQSKGES